MKVVILAGGFGTRISEEKKKELTSNRMIKKMNLHKIKNSL